MTKKIMNKQISQLLRANYPVVEFEDLTDALMSGQMIVGADVNVSLPLVRIVPQNFFLYNPGLNILEVYTGENRIHNMAYVDLYLNRELHFPEDDDKAKEYMTEYVEKFIKKNYDICYYLAPNKIKNVFIPAFPIPHINIEATRSWLYTGDCCDE